MLKRKGGLVLECRGLFERSGCLNRGFTVTQLFISRSFHRTGSHVVKRFVDYPRACQEIYSRLDPQDYFGTTDVFIPRFIYTIECAGTANNAPTCGPSNGHMHCLTRKGRIEFVRMPRRLSQCRRQRRVVISNVPVGCYCV